MPKRQLMPLKPLGSTMKNDLRCEEEGGVGKGEGVDGCVKVSVEGVGG